MLDATEEVLEMTSSRVGPRGSAEFGSDARRGPAPGVAQPGRTSGNRRDEDVVIAAGPAALEGHLVVPTANPNRRDGVVVFAHGSGSSRHSPRNRYVASVLNDAGLGTLLVDLLTPDEALERSNVFDIEFLAERLTATTRWVRGRDDLADATVGYFGASTGAAAALWAAADPDSGVASVVSRGGRPDLAARRLADVRCPTLLIVGGDDDLVVDLNITARALMPGRTELHVIAGAGHLFEEPGALAEVARLATDWFLDTLARPR